MIERIKSVFRIDSLLTWVSYGIRNCTDICFALVDNGVITSTEKLNPKSIKYMLGTGGHGVGDRVSDFE
ncbi:MAG: hypothetical protein ABJB76_12345 [Candidatus Nitrosocosmicus sp.]